MRGKRTNRTYALSRTLVFMALAVWLGGCSIAQQWDGNGLSGPGIADAAPATETSVPNETATPDVVKPEQPAVKPPDKEIPAPFPIVPNPEKYKNKKLVALTFDDGPDGKYTQQILEILEEYNVKATFFVVGLQVEKYPEIAKKIVEEGHSIGNHSWSHRDLSKLSSKALDNELNKTQQVILNATGVTSLLMRAPYGAISNALLNSVHQENMKHVFWTVDTRDWAGSSVAEMHKNVLAHTHKGGIILMHSFGGRKHAIDHTVKLLPIIIKDLRERGYEFATVEQLIESGQAHSSVVK
ncbi:polysaccharide deacetylase family protein [Cohnella silvisoli]|uniref:Polysaccharide deacetylase family protein n=1 Tax=Cohnella silvisoli TaxID=2873699 RepID=A0ABV1KQ84_9BACL|nr:polysaccharide deacetylase family protein [Cohnella silvisoli]MCD9022095.1 polysaccharide deacetylase family protein [Cohnella silvisoli]